MKARYAYKFSERLKFRLFIRLLKWYCRGTDQWDLFQLRDQNTTWFVAISLKPLAGGEDDKNSYEDSYRKID